MIEAEAYAHSLVRAEQAMDAMCRAKTKTSSATSQTPYNGVDSTPIREKLVERHGDIAMPRNCYGALCLNTLDVLFVDIDQDIQRKTLGFRLLFWLMLFDICAAWRCFASIHLLT